LDGMKGGGKKKKKKQGQVVKGEGGKRGLDCHS